MIAAVSGARCGQATYIAKTLYRNFRTFLSQDGVLSMVLLLMDQIWDLGSYLRERIVQGFLSWQTLQEVFSEISRLLDQFSKVQQR